MLPTEDRTMNVWFHTTILATALAATVAVGLASAAIYADIPVAAAPKADKLPIYADARATDYVTVETRRDGVSVLSRIPLEATN
jgi:hypothetical protein